MEPEKISEIMPRVKADKKPQKQETQFPVAKKETSRIPTPMQAMELSLIFNTSPEERKQRWGQRSLKNDYYIKAAAPTANDPGQPGLIREEDLNTLLVCFLLLKHSRIKTNKYTFETTPYQILKFSGADTGGANYTDISKSLSRLAANYITTNFWWDKVLGQRIDESNFHFLEGVDKGQDKALRITLGSKIVESLEKGYVKFLTESSLRDILKLRGHAKVLALFLLKLVGSKSRQDLNLQTVLRYLGVEDKYNGLPKKYFNLYIKRTIILAMGKASNAIGLSCVFDKDRQKFHLRRIRGLKQIESHEGELSLGPEAERKQQAFSRLADVGIHPEMITNLFNEANIEEIERQIEWLPHRKSDNPAGILVSAIRSRWAMPPEYEQKREETLKSRGS